LDADSSDKTQTVEERKLSPESERAVDKEIEVQIIVE
jgi:hypothetical protein